MAARRAQTDRGTSTRVRFDVTLRNETSQPARFALFEVRGSSGYGALAKHVREEQQRLERGETALGPPTFAVLRRRIAVSPRKNGELALELRQGTFALVCANGPDPGTALFLAGRLEVER